MLRPPRVLAHPSNIILRPSFVGRRLAGSFDLAFLAPGFSPAFFLLNRLATSSGIALQLLALVRLT
jgi:hypothetical protein